ncbi:hypothetical protein HFD88_009219 [Aspergillus terreus]|nr:hypothetical protein HFD88_009219 [Aspergillus terreus]
MSQELLDSNPTAAKPDAGDKHDFSLANPQANPQAAVYIDPQYRHYNPQYGNADQGPVWSLAQPLPHVVRDGMRPSPSPEHSTEQTTTDEHQGPAAHEPPTDTTKYEQEDPGKKVSQPDERGFFNRWSKIRYYIREPLAEWLGVTVALTIGLGAGLATFTSQSQAGSFPSLAAAWGFGFMLAIYLAGGVSGGHLNPAITISLSVWRGFPARKCVVYLLAQIVGAITAGGFVYAIYHDAIVSSAAMSGVPQNQSNAAQALLTMPKEFVQPATAFFNEFLGSAILVGCIFALGDDTNAPPGAGMQAFIVGIMISVLVLALGYNTGGCFNGARDFGPRLVVVMAGWGGHLFREKHAWWVWGPWIASIAGGLAGAFIYDLALFTGGESPVNYPRRRRKRAMLLKEKKWRHRLGIWRRKNVEDVEKAVKEMER